MRSPHGLNLNNNQNENEKEKTKKKKDEIMNARRTCVYSFDVIIRNAAGCDEFKGLCRCEIRKKEMRKQTKANGGCRLPAAAGQV